MVKLDKPEVSAEQRVAHAITRLNRWVSNCEANAQRATEREDYDRARDLTIRANDFRDVVAMLDGSEDGYIARLSEWNLPA